MRENLTLAIIWLILSLAVQAKEPTVKWTTVNPGNGPEAKLGDQLAISYRLTLANGTLIEETPDNQSFKLVLGSAKAIPGLSQGLVGMRRGETRELVIPPSLGYGSRQVGPIPPDSTLLFRVELNYFVKGSKGDSLAQRFGKDGFENRPDARNLDKPAMFEYLIRDFFTRPWRYDDSPQLIWKANAFMTLLVFLLWGLSRRRQGGGEV